MDALLQALNIKPGEILVNIAGFLVVFWVLRKLLYGPIGAVLKQREEAVRADLDRAAQASADAERERAALQERLAQIEREHRDAIQRATAEAGRAAEQVLQAARADAQAQLEKAQQQIEGEKNKALVELRQEVADLAVDASEAVLRRTLTDDRHRVIVDEFLHDLEAQRTSPTAR